MRTGTSDRPPPRATLQGMNLPLINRPLRGVVARGRALTGDLLLAEQAGLDVVPTLIGVAGDSEDDVWASVARGEVNPQMFATALLTTGGYLTNEGTDL